MNRLAINITPYVEHKGFTLDRWEYSCNGRAFNTFNTFEHEHAGSHGSSGVAGADSGTGLAIPYEVKGNPYRRVALSPDCVGSRVVHTDHFTGMVYVNIKRFAGMFGQFLFK